MNILRDKVTFGFWVYIMSDCVLFAALFATYAVLSGATYGAIAIDDIVNLPFVLGETLILLASSCTVGLALVAAERGKKQLTLALLAATLLLGLSFVAMEVSEFVHLAGEGNGPSASAFLSAFFTLLGTHGLHVVLGALWMAVLIGYVVWKGLTETALRRLTILSLFWHFLDIIWIFIFTFVYLFGAL